LAFSLHFPYEILAFGGGDGDTLHGRPFLWWLDGFGVFTMPRETVVCSIILCIYLADTLSLRGATMPNGQKYEDWIKDKEDSGKDVENE